jgi:hypothetical protein
VVALDIRRAGAIDRLLRETSHAKQSLPQIVKALLKARAHYANLPSPKSAVGRWSLVVGPNLLATLFAPPTNDIRLNDVTYPNLPVI